MRCKATVAASGRATARDSQGSFNSTSSAMGFGTREMPTTTPRSWREQRVRFANVSRLANSEFRSNGAPHTRRNAVGTDQSESAPQPCHAGRRPGGRDKSPWH